MVQMILDITFLAVLVRILTTVAQRTMERRGVKVGDGSHLVAGSTPPTDDS